MDGSRAGPTIYEGVKRNFLSLDKVTQTSALDRDCVDEHFLPTIIWLDEAETLCFVVGLHFAHHHQESLSGCTCARPRNKAGCVVLDTWREQSARLKAKGETGHMSGQSRLLNIGWI
jgi:hypothetical protein